MPVAASKNARTAARSGAAKAIWDSRNPSPLVCLPIPEFRFARGAEPTSCGTLRDQDDHDPFMAESFRLVAVSQYLPPCQTYVKRST